jgi:hypothetical protein
VTFSRFVSTAGLVICSHEHRRYDGRAEPLVSYINAVGSWNLGNTSLNPVVLR